MTLRQIKKVLINLDHLQSNQLESFDKQLMPDLEIQMSERAALILDLKKQMGIFMLENRSSDPSEHIDMIQEIKSHILTLMNQNKKLVSKINSQKDKLKNSIQNVTKGRQSIQAYGSFGESSSLSKVLNIRK